MEPIPEKHLVHGWHGFSVDEGLFTWKELFQLHPLPLKLTVFLADLS